MKARLITEKDFEKLDPENWSVLPKQALEELCIFSVRYCQGRRTHAPHTVLPIVLSNLESFSQKTLSVLISDYEYAKRMGEFGDPDIDKPMWEEYAKRLYAERERRRDEA